MAGSGGTENAILTDQELLDAICCADLSNQLGDLRIPVTSVAANDEERALNTLRDRLEDAGDERLRVVRLLENLDLLAETRTSSR